MTVEVKTGLFFRLTGDHPYWAEKGPFVFSEDEDLILPPYGSVNVEVVRGMVGVAWFNSGNRWRPWRLFEEGSEEIEWYAEYIADKWRGIQWPIHGSSAGLSFRFEGYLVGDPWSVVDNYDKEIKRVEKLRSIVGNPNFLTNANPDVVKEKIARLKEMEKHVEAKRRNHVIAQWVCEDHDRDYWMRQRDMR